jgi:phenylalanyl-tRNA synthetase alpha chain
MTSPHLTADGVESAKVAALAAIAQAPDLDALKEVKINFVGDRSPISKFSQELGKLEAAQRAEFGKVVGQAKSAITQAFDQRFVVLESERDARVLVEERVDVSIPARRTPKGGLHPLTLLTNEICDLFLGMGYRVAEGPELEAEWLNFDALNIPADHPARTMQDTFFIEPLNSHLVLRTHTSPVQVRTMLEEEPPIYVICPGRTYRADELDATHTPVFSQVEGLVIDKGITMADLKGTLDHFARSIFGPEVKTRLRSSFFPFTEPSAEVDFYFNGRWIEWGGCGMVNPKVLRAAGIDPEIYSGFAFGMGLERTLMVRHGITDMHDIVEGDLRFSQGFGTGGR